MCIPVGEIIQQVRKAEQGKAWGEYKHLGWAEKEDHTRSKDEGGRRKARGPWVLEAKEETFQT